MDIEKATALSGLMTEEQGFMYSLRQNLKCQLETFLCLS